MSREWRRAPFDAARLYVFDADDTLRRTRVAGQPCPRAPGEWELLPGVRERLRGIVWGAGGALLGVASNQDQVAYGYLSEETARRLLVDAVREAAGVEPPPGAVQLCPHALDVPCDCRKPAPGMLLRIMDYYHVAPAETLFVGNAPSDAEAARRAGARFAWAHDFFGWEDRRG
jgi:D-glycero-D-manno-heptose 1,7-bisphosphate phosphatase